MVSRNLMRAFDLPADQLADELRDAFGDSGKGEWLPSESQDFRENKLLTGRVRRITGEVVLVDVGYKSEGAIELREWYDEDAGQVVPPRPGDEVQVLLLIHTLAEAVWFAFFCLRRLRSRVLTRSRTVWK